MKVKVPYLTQRTGAKGKVRWYWQPSAELRRMGFRLERLSDDPAAAVKEAQALNVAVAERRAGQLVASRPDDRSVAALIRAYRTHRLYLDLRPRTRRGYDQLLEQIDEWAGDRPVARIQALDVDRLYSTVRKRTPSLANHLLVMLRVLFGFAQMQQWRTDNPARQVKGRTVKPKQRPIWSREAIAAFVAAADRLGRHSVGTAVLVNSWCGQREGDVLGFARPRLAGDEVRLAQSKTGVEVVLPVDLVPHLVERIRGELARQDARKVTALTLIVSEETGQPYTQRNFAEWVERIRTAAAADVEAVNAELAAELRQLHFQRLRATAVVELYLAGCDFGLISQITGHTAKAMQTIIDHYLPRRRDLARAAFRKRLEKEQQG